VWPRSLPVFLDGGDPEAQLIGKDTVGVGGREHVAVVGAESSCGCRRWSAGLHGSGAGCCRSRCCCRRKWKSSTCLSARCMTAYPAQHFQRCEVGIALDGLEERGGYGHVVLVRRVEKRVGEKAVFLAGGGAAGY